MSARSIENLKKSKRKSFTIDPNVFDIQRELERKIGLKVIITNKKIIQEKYQSNIKIWNNLI